MSDTKTTKATATYDVAADALQVTLIAGVAAVHTVNIADTLALDNDADGRLIGIEVLDVRDQPDLPGLLRGYGVDLQTLPVTLIGVGRKPETSLEGLATLLGQTHEAIRALQEKWRRSLT